MNRTNLCIRMLQLLKARGKMNTAQLAEALEVNPRNIREFKKELVLAGYNVEEVKGRYGGYILNDQYDLPVTVFTDEEKDALVQSYKFMRTQKDFKPLTLYCDAMDKIIATSKISSNDSLHYMSNQDIEIDENTSRMIDTTQKAIHHGLCVLLSYQSLKDETPIEFEVEPYEIIHYHKSYYLIGFSLLRKDYRMYRFSNQRMFKCELSSRSFIRDNHFHLSNHIGEHSLIKLDMKQIRVRVYHKDNGLRFFHEKKWGNNLQIINKQNEFTDFEFFTDDMSGLYQFLFSMQDQMELLGPEEVRFEYVKRVEKIINTYKG
ncbi:YafY family protein [uncultured Holdemanella sp.]|uniref:helix-turn-helix transcriptional regulator n=2 Tax=uncultured Holdemanella sp. TaxID=1763549 RepID=UPI0025CFB2FC|nr:WYL domain-containing protein [uncultured Holdemanella sp.]